MTPKTYLHLGLALGLLLFLAGAYAVGRHQGAASVQQSWDKARADQAEADAKETQNALDETRRLASAAADKAREDLEAAVRASEERQAARVAQAVRQAALESATRQGVYVAPECRLDDQTFEQLQEQLK